jgi:ABC-type dipeptide/oligopeptide/nickel transport system permease subunit
LLTDVLYVYIDPRIRFARIAHYVQPFRTRAVMSTVVKLTDKSDGASLTRIASRRLRRDKLTILALAILFLLTLLSLAAPLISQYILGVDPTSTDGYNHMLPVATSGHILGTDNLARSTFAVLFAGQVSLGIAVVGGVSLLALVCSSV